MLMSFAKDCQFMAAKLAHHQNEAETKLTPQHVEKLVNTLLNAGNSMAKLLTDGKIQTDPEPELNKEDT